MNTTMNIRKIIIYIILVIIVVIINITRPLLITIFALAVAIISTGIALVIVYHLDPEVLDGVMAARLVLETVM